MRKSFAFLSVRRIIPVTLLMLLVLQGCGKFRSHASHPYVYVWVREMFLRNRVAPVNQPVTQVVNGQRLEVLQQVGRFTQVKAPNGKVGWLANETVIDQSIYDKFAELAKENEHTPVLSHGLLRESYYWLRDAPSRDSDRFYLLHRNAKLELLKRASVPRPEPPGALPRMKNGAPAPPVLEDFWLARDAQGHVGWVRGGALDEDVPQDVALLSIGKKVLEAKVLRTVYDPESNRPNHEVPEYVVALVPWGKYGLPYDFDEVCVYTWDVRRHHWETAFRDRDVQGYLPIRVSQETVKGRSDPVFSFRVATNDSARIDPKTGYAEAGTEATERFRMMDTIVRRVEGPASSPKSVAGKKFVHGKKGSHSGRR